MDHNQAFMMKVHWPIGYHPLKDRICSSELQSWRSWQLKSWWLIITMDHNYAVHFHFLWKLKKMTFHFCQFGTKILNFQLSNLSRFCQGSRFWRTPNIWHITQIARQVRAWVWKDTKNSVFFRLLPEVRSAINPKSTPWPNIVILLTLLVVVSTVNATTNTFSSG